MNKRKISSVDSDEPFGPPVTSVSEPTIPTTVDCAIVQRAKQALADERQYHSRMLNHFQGISEAFSGSKVENNVAETLHSHQFMECDLFTDALEQTLKDKSMDDNFSLWFRAMFDKPSNWNGQSGFWHAFVLGCTRVTMTKEIGETLEKLDRLYNTYHKTVKNVDEGCQRHTDDYEDNDACDEANVELGQILIELFGKDAYFFKWKHQQKSPVSWDV